MTIKQQGGIFGRNPTFNDVEVDGVLDANEINAADLNATNEITAKSQVLTDTSGPVIRLSRNDTSLTTADRIGGIEFYQNDPSSAGAGVVAGIFCENESSFSGLGSLVFKVGDASSYDEVARINSSGNLKFINGKGIDFSATSGTGTSELFSDYEEGNWTPIYEPSTGSFGSVTYDTITGAKYTKIGNVVHVQGAMRTDAITVGTASGDVRLGGLPFAVSTYVNGQDAWASLNFGYSSAFNTNNPSSGSFKTQTTYADLFYRTSANGGSVALAVGDLGTGTNDNLIRFSGTYITD